jgi:hypothetical protein
MSPAESLALSSASDNVSAVVHDYSDATGKRAAVTHPFGPNHPNAVRTRDRLVARGYQIVAERAPDPRAAARAAAMLAVTGRLP